MRLTRAHLKRGMWIVLGNQMVEGYNMDYISCRKRLFDYRNSPTWSRELQWHSQDKNPYKLLPQQITRMSPLTCRLRYKDGDTVTHTFRIKEISHIFNSHTEYIAWRNDYLKQERDEIRQLHQDAKKDKAFWSKRRAELRHWNRIDDLRRIKKI